MQNAGNSKAHLTHSTSPSAPAAAAAASPSPPPPTSLPLFRLIFCSFVIRRPREKKKTPSARHADLLFFPFFLPSLCFSLSPRPRQLKLSFRAFNFRVELQLRDSGSVEAVSEHNAASGRGIKPGEPKSEHILLPLADGTAICPGRHFRK